MDDAADPDPDDDHERPDASSTSGSFSFVESADLQGLDPLHGALVEAWAGRTLQRQLMARLQRQEEVLSESVLESAHVISRRLGRGPLQTLVASEEALPLPLATATAGPELADARLFVSYSHADKRFVMPVR